MEKEVAELVWKEMANSLGFETEKDMFEELFVKKDWNMGQLSRKLGYDRCTIRVRLLKLGFAMKKRGGGNNKGKGKSRLDRYNKTYMLEGDPTEIAVRAGVCVSAVYRYRAKLRGKEQEEDAKKLLSSESSDRGDASMAAGTERDGVSEERAQTHLLDNDQSGSNGSEPTS